MGDAMMDFLDKGPIETSRQLDDYCYHVAGRIGSNFLNELIRQKDCVDGKPVELDDELAAQFGRYLQFINIIKGIRKDYNEGRKFLPGELIHRGISYEFMMESKTSLDAQDVRDYVFNRVLEFAETRFERSVRYVKSIPSELSGYKAFCLVPLITGQKTIENMRDSKAEKVFNGDEDATKISYGIGSIMNFSYYLAKNDEGKKANRWLDEFGNSPRRFSFKPDDYVLWAKDFIDIESDTLKKHLGIA